MVPKHFAFPTIFLVFVTTPFIIKTTLKNTCTNYLDYFFINFGGDCYYNSDVDSNVEGIIRSYVGKVTKYNVTTEDGYILTMFRITRENPVGVIVLQPPISTGAMAWLSDGKDSLALQLWKRGFEVWLTNHRGVSYSRQHVNLTDIDPEFWNYSFHEIALYDFEAQFKLISKETKGAKVTYIGYSMSATEALVYASMKVKSAQKYIDSFILIAPVSVMQNFTSGFRFIFYLLKPFEMFFRKGEFLTLELVRWIVPWVNFAPHGVNLFSSFVMGWTPFEMDPVLYPYIFPHHGRGITNKMIYHFGQIYFNNSNFRMFDYGAEENRNIYGFDFPPVYPLEDIKNPLYIIYGDTDILATPSDIMTLCQKLLPKEHLRGVYEIPQHNHIDFIFSKNRQTKTYSTIFKILDEIYNNY